jgi:hypothetical protein
MTTDCCNFSDRMGTPRTRIDSGTSLNKMSSFFCERHRAATLSSQYRFLPALAHAKRMFATALQTHVQWVTLVDDDSMVNTAMLLQTLSALDHTVPVYAGDLIYWNGGRPAWDTLGDFSDAVSPAVK